MLKVIHCSAVLLSRDFFAKTFVSISVTTNSPRSARGCKSLGSSLASPIWRCVIRFSRATWSGNQPIGILPESPPASCRHLSTLSLVDSRAFYNLWNGNSSSTSRAKLNTFKKSKRLPSFGTQYLPWASQCRYLNAAFISPSNFGGTLLYIFHPSRISFSNDTCLPLFLYSARKFRDNGSFFLR